jgi:hypothetical protein
MSNEIKDIEIDIVSMSGKLDRIADSIDIVKDRCDEISICVQRVKKAVYEPDQGLYARIREIEQWKESTSKIIWVIMTSIVGLATATVWHTFFK